MIRLVLVLLGVMLSQWSGHDSQAQSSSILHHALELEILPETHELIAQDRVRLSSSLLREHSLTFELNPKLTVQEVTLGGQILSVEKQVGGEDSSLTQKWMVRIPESLQTSSSGELTITYQGAINDPPQASKGLRFVRPDKTNGYIGNDGV